MTCVMGVEDAPISSRVDFSTGVHIGGDIAREGRGDARAMKEAVRNVIYAGMDEPYGSSQFWQFQGAMRGIYAVTGDCPHCGREDTCGGPWR